MSKQKYVQMDAETECARCGCYLMHHHDGGNGACKKCSYRSYEARGRICKRFCTRENLQAIRFFDFVHWAKKWVKAKRTRNITQLYQVWDQLGDDTYCTTCVQCNTSTIMYNTTSKNVVKRQDGLSCASCFSCATCCKCIECARCHRRVRQDILCSSCNMCADGRCCHCKSCRKCGKRCDDDYCNDGTGNGCMYCNACCECDDAHRVPFYTAYNRKAKFYKASLKQHSTNPTNRFIAAEIEIAGISLRGRPIYQKVKEWDAAVVRDGSLPAGGFEICTAPASGDIFVQQIQDFCRAVKEQGGVVNERCGLHVHVDARDFRYYDLRRLVRVYAAIEDVLFAMVHPKRRASKYCMPCAQKYLASIEEGRVPYDKVKTDVITSVYQAQTTQDNRYSKYNNARYNALNLHSWFYRGTIECRMFDGTIDPDAIVKWGILWAMILDYATTQTDDQITQLIKTHSGFGCLATIASSNESILDFVRRRVLLNGHAEIKEEMAKYNRSVQQQEMPVA